MRMYDLVLKFKLMTFIPKNSVNSEIKSPETQKNENQSTFTPRSFARSVSDAVGQHPRCSGGNTFVPATFSPVPPLAERTELGFLWVSALTQVRRFFSQLTVLPLQAEHADVFQAAPR